MIEPGTKLDQEATFHAGEPVAVFKADSILEGYYDVTADGQRLLINNSKAYATSFTVELNWTKDLKR